MIAMMMMMFIMSSDLGSADNTRPILTSIIRKWFPALASQLSLAQIDVLDFVIRKCTHIAEYAVLALLTARAFAITSSSPFKTRFIAAFTAAVYALSDELHQSFVPSRGAAYMDVLWDSLGASLGSLAIYMVQLRQRTKSLRP